MRSWVPRMLVDMALKENSFVQLPRSRIHDGTPGSQFGDIASMAVVRQPPQAVEKNWGSMLLMLPSSHSYLVKSKADG